MREFPPSFAVPEPAHAGAVRRKSPMRNVKTCVSGLFFAHPGSPEDGTSHSCLLQDSQPSQQ